MISLALSSASSRLMTCVFLEESDASYPQVSFGGQGFMVLIAGPLAPNDRIYFAGLFVLRRHHTPFWKAKLYGLIS